MGSMGGQGTRGSGYRGSRLPGVQVPRGPESQYPDVRSRVPESDPGSQMPDVRSWVPGAICQILVRYGLPGPPGTGY